MRRLTRNFVQTGRLYSKTGANTIKEVHRPFETVKFELVKEGQNVNPTAAVLVAFDEMFSKQTEYVPKNHGKSLESLHKDVTTLLKEPLYYDDDVIETALQFGYKNKEEAMELFEGYTPKYVKSDGSFDWDFIMKRFGKTSYSNSLLKSIRGNFEALTESIAKENKALEKAGPINWLRVQETFGEEFAYVMRENYLKSLDAIPKYDFDQLNAKLDSVFNPMFEKAKDEFINGMPDLIESVKWCQTRAKLLQKDAYGLPYDFNSFEYLDEYEPEVRDELIMEVEEENYDLKYKEDLKALPISTLEDMFAVNNKKELAAMQKIEERLSHSTIDQSSMSPRQAALVQLMKDVQEQHIKNKTLEQEIINMKSQVDQIMQAKAKAARGKGSKDKGKKVVGDEKSEKVWREFLKARGIVIEESPDGSSVKVFQIQADGSLIPHPEFQSTVSKKKTEAAAPTASEE